MTSVSLDLSLPPSYTNSSSEIQRTLAIPCDQIQSQVSIRAPDVSVLLYVIASDLHVVS